MALTSTDAEGRRFTRSVRGYTSSDVESFQADVVHALRALEERVSISDAKREDAERRLAGLQATIDKEVEDAAKARMQIIAEARASASAMVEAVRGIEDRAAISNAAEAATAIVAQAESKARRIVDDAERRRSAMESNAAAIVADAERDAAVTRAEAERVLDEARVHAKRLRAAAQSADSDSDEITIDLRESSHPAATAPSPGVD